MSFGVVNAIAVVVLVVAAVAAAGFFFGGGRTRESALVMNGMVKKPATL